MDANSSMDNADDSSSDDEQGLKMETEFVEEEEEFESEPELECDVWDDDCVVIEKKPPILYGYYIMPNSDSTPTKPPAKKLKTSLSIRSKLTNQQFVENFQNSWNNNIKLIESDTEIIVDPFKLCVVNNFIETANILHDIILEFDEINWQTRHLDLYEFFQSNDLKTLTDFKTISKFYEFLKNDIKLWISKLTGYEFDSVSATCSNYTNTDYLLVHDDLREDRLVAFILYLTPEKGWSEKQGGGLQIFNCDNNGHPKDVVRNILPVFNQLVFFSVTNKSYHAVDEVNSLTDCRFSINGWFHTKKPPIYEQPKHTPYPDGLFSSKNRPPIKIDLELSSWITEEYLNCETINEIQKYFEENSEICLRNFLKMECFNEISNLIRNTNLEWVRIGPPNRNNYEVLKINNLPDVLDRFLKLFQSKQMFSLLQRFTDLDLGTKRARMKFELQRWQPGCYSLLSDYDWQKKELDLLFFVGCQNNSDVIGARTQYVTIDDEIQNALITIDPEENHLNIIYRDTARFTKYFSKQSNCKCFYTLICSYLE